MEYKITTSVGVITIRGLKHREVKQLQFRDRVETDAEALVDDVLQTVLAADAIALVDDLISYERMDLFKKIVDLTFMTEEQRKNYNWQWDSTMPGPTAPVRHADQPVSNRDDAVQTSA